MASAIKPARRLARRSLRKARFVARSARYRELLDRHPGFALAFTPNGRWLIADTTSRLAMTEVMQANLGLVAPLLESDDIPYFFVPSVSENRIRLGVLETHSDRVLDALAVAFEDQPVYFDVFTETTRHREVLADALPALLRTAGRVLLVRVYRAYVWPNNAFAADGLHAAEVEFWQESDTAWTAPFGNRISTSIPLALARRATVTSAGRTYPTLAPFADSSHADLLDFPVDLVFPLPAPATSPDRPGLRRALRSIWMHSEGFRTVVVVVGDQTPDWLVDSHPSLRIVQAGGLPQRAAQDPRLAGADIPGVADRHVVMGDNVLLRRPFRPSDCFNSNGLARIWTDRNLLTSPDAPVDPTAHRPDAVKTGETMVTATTGGPLLDRALDMPLCAYTPAVHELRKLVEEQSPAVVALDPFDVQYFAFASGLAVGASLRHEVIDATSPLLPRMLRRAGVATSVSTLAGIEPAGEVQGLLDRWYPAPSPFERTAG